ncbi:MAG: GntR family transcriptional regulator [Deltaproteobacteria bacterium]|nr:GntR family transcriptional regulator [Deltaproteobacteria bacterium]
MKLNKVDAKTLRQQVYDQLRHRIITGEIVPGQSIKLRDLAEQFGVSLMPVREALWQLESEKVIVIESNRSIHVNGLTARDMQEAMEIRLMLEPLAAQRACELRPDSAVPKVQRILDDLQAAIDKPKRYMMKNNQFHFAIYSYSDSAILLQMIDWLWARVGPYVFIHATKVGDLSPTMKYHEEIFEAFANRDKEHIAVALRRDLGDYATFIIDFLKLPTST